MAKHIKMHQWEEWQSYRKDRGTPPWIKVHRNLLSNHKWVTLTDAEKGQLVSMWIVAADSHGVLPDDANLIRKMAGLDDLPNLQKFKELNWVVSDGCQLGVNMASSGCQHDAPETETETETDKNPLTPQGGTERFSDFWLSWPVSERKTDKKQCQDKWRAYKLDAIADDVIIALEAWKASKDWRKNSGAFIPAPKVWLNGRRWETPPQIKVTQEYNKEDLPF